MAYIVLPLNLFIQKTQIKIMIFTSLLLARPLPKEWRYKHSKLVEVVLMNSHKVPPFGVKQIIGQRLKNGKRVNNRKSNKHPKWQ